MTDHIDVGRVHHLLPVLQHRLTFGYIYYVMAYLSDAPQCNKSYLHKLNQEWYLLWNNIMKLFSEPICSVV